jgi:hypothetical protein
MKKAASDRRPFQELNLTITTNDDGAANHNGGHAPIRSDDLGHRDDPNRGPG